MEASPPKEAVVLSGGGANGAYEVGVLKALFAGKSPSTGRTPLAPHIFAGTSIGSYNAAFLGAQWDTYGAGSAGNLEAVWLERLAGVPNGAYRLRADPLILFEPQRYVSHPFKPLLQLAGDGAFLGWDGLQRVVHLFASRDESLRQRLVEMVDLTSFVSTEPWEETIRDTVRFDLLRGSSRQVRVAATNWTTGALRLFANLDMTDRMGPLIIKASSAIPGIFPPVLLGAEPHVDGGILMNTPLKPATDLGADVIHVVYLDPEVRTIPFGDLQSTMGSIYRQQAIAWAKTVNDDIEDARVINRGLEIFGYVEQGREVDEQGAKDIAKSFPKIVQRVRKYLHYRPLTIHRYHPRDDLSGGPAGLLNLDRGHVHELIERGFADAVQHDCESAGCVRPKALGPEAARVDASPPGG